MIYKGKIENIEQKTASNGQQYLVYTANGKKFNVFNAELQQFNIGDFITITTEKKGKYENVINIIHTPISEQSVSVVSSTPVSVSPVVAHDTIIIQRTEKPHSYEFGKANNRHKVYYGDINELKAHIDALKLAGLVEEFDTERVE